MKCPVCPDATLAMSDRQGVEIDYCPQCRGVWLDRGELDKLLQMGARQENHGTRQPSSMPTTRHDDRHRHADFQDSDYGKRQGGYGGYRKKSWLNELFD